MSNLHQSLIDIEAFGSCYKSHLKG